LQLSCNKNSWQLWVCSFLGLFVVKKCTPAHRKPRTAPIFAGMTPAEINLKWSMLQQRIAEDFDNEKPDLKVMLFLIGVQELGQGARKFSKRQKEELMHIANCKLFSLMGFYELEGLDQDGWPHWKRIGVIPNYTLLEQEMVLKSLMIEYFESMENN
jgi:hypothetical protein